MKLKLTNPTAFPADVKVFCESSQDTNKRVKSFVESSAKKIHIPANSTIEKVFSLENN